MALPSAFDQITARNNTKVTILVNGTRVGRVQSISQSITNNVQVLSELGRAFNVELKKGITSYAFSISKFWVRKDPFEALKLGQIFSLEIRDDSSVDDFTSGTAETLEIFKYCSLTSISRDYTVGQAVVVENASVVAIGKGHDIPDGV